MVHKKWEAGTVPHPPTEFGIPAHLPPPPLERGCDGHPSAIEDGSPPMWLGTAGFLPL